YSQTHLPLLDRASCTFCYRCARSSATRRSSPSRRCPTHCQIGSSNRRRRCRPTAAGTARSCTGCRDQSDAAAHRASPSPPAEKATTSKDQETDWHSYVYASGWLSKKVEAQNVQKIMECSNGNL